MHTYEFEILPVSDPCLFLDKVEIIVLSFYEPVNSTGSEHVNQTKTSNIFRSGSEHVNKPHRPISFLVLKLEVFALRWSSTQKNFFSPILFCGKLLSYSNMLTQTMHKKFANWLCCCHGNVLVYTFAGF